jgi:inward rectifier potassium channel
MAIGNRMNPFSRLNDDTGFGSNASSYGGRFINKDGSFNIRKTGQPFWNRTSIYYFLLNMPAWKFTLLVLGSYFVVNVVFTSLYLLVGIGGLTGITGTTGLRHILEVFFFSTETFTTVGYGRVNPTGVGINCVAALESLSGFVALAVGTGLIFGRFARPKPFLSFSNNAVIAPYKGRTGLMFRMAAYKENHHLTNAEITVNLAVTLQEEGVPVFRFFSLHLERSRVDTLSMNWTVVHPIDDESPLVGFTKEDLKTADAEIYVLCRGFDDVFSNMVQQRTSYTFDEIIFNAKFLPMYKESVDGKTTIMEVDKLNEYKLLPEKGEDKA